MGAALRQAQGERHELNKLKAISIGNRKHKYPTTSRLGHLCHQRGHQLGHPRRRAAMAGGEGQPGLAHAGAGLGVVQ